MKNKWARLMPLALTLLAWVVIGVLAVLLVGCGSRSNTQIVADLKAKAEAYQRAPNEGIAKVIADAIAADIMAATAFIEDLPKPSMSVPDILAHPEKALDEAEDSQEDPPPYVPPKVATPDPTPEIFIEFGTWVLRIGMAGVSLTILAFAATRLFGVKLLGSLVEEVFILSALGCLIGVGLIWTGRNTWVLYATILGFVALQVYNYRAAWLPFFRKQLPDVKG